MRKVFKEMLPHKGNIINWNKCENIMVHFIYDNIEGDIEIIKYLKERSRILVKYNDKEYNIKTGHFVNCNIGKILGKITSDYKIEIGTRFKDDKRDITIIDRKYRKGKGKCYKYKCNICGFNCGKHYSFRNKQYKSESWRSEYDILNGQECSCCCKSPSIVVEHINSIIATDKWMIPIINDIEFCKTHTYGSSDKIYPTCPDCSKINNKLTTINDIYRKHYISCQHCNDGIKYPNKFMTELLKQLQIEFETEYSPEWIGLRRYDFYLSSLNLIIEMDGGLGHGNKVHSKDKKTIEESKAIDDYKDNEAKLHNIRVIRIDCDYNKIENRFKFIQQNVINKISSIFDLNIIDWNKCHEFALSNLIKKVCEYKNNNPNMTTTEIGKIMGYSQTGVTNWLKIGTELRWCDYCADEERKNRKSLGIEVYKNNILIGIYKNANKLDELSEDLFGIKLNSSHIYDVCIGKRKSHKGFTFKYVK